MKKGALFTLAFSFLGILLLALAFTVHSNEQQYDDQVLTLSVLDRIYEIDSSIDKSLKDLFYLNSGIIINKTPTTIDFIESLPNSNSINTSFLEFKNFAEKNISNINLKLDTILTEIPLQIKPYDITYKHSSDIIFVIYPTINFNGFDISIQLNGNISTCTSDVESGTFPFSLTVQDTKGSTCIWSDPIDSSDDSEFEINNELIIEFDENQLEIRLENSSLTSIIKTSISLSNTNQSYVRFANPSLSINYTDFGILKESYTTLR